jgi:hypothetical protein
MFRLLGLRFCSLTIVRWGLNNLISLMLTYAFRPPLTCLPFNMFMICYAFAFEDGGHRLASMAVEHVDRLAFLVVV